MLSQKPMQVAGQERGVLPIGVWSTSSTRSMLSKPDSPVQPTSGGALPASIASRPARLARCCTQACTLVSSTSRASVDLPEPLTPVTATRRRSGTATLRFCRLCSCAPCTVSQRTALPACALACALACAPAGALVCVPACALACVSGRASGAPPGGGWRRGGVGVGGKGVGVGWRVGRGGDAAPAALRPQPPAAFAGARADVDDVVGAADGAFVMLDHHQRVALVAQ